MISAQSLGLKRHSLVWELAEVYFCFFFWKFLNLSIFQVPVVLIFTKFDALEDKCYSKLRGQGMSHQEAKNNMYELANKTFQDSYLPRVLGAEFPPKSCVCLKGNILYSLIFFKFS
jgi:hypothetical protein